jgi:hypothetical protein
VNGSESKCASRPKAEEHYVVSFFAS